MTETRKLEVYYHGSRVGYLAETTDHMVAKDTLKPQDLIVAMGKRYSV